MKGYKDNVKLLEYVLGRVGKRGPGEGEEEYRFWTAGVQVNWCFGSGRCTARPLSRSGALGPTRRLDLAPSDFSTSVLKYVALRLRTVPVLDHLVTMVE